MYNIRFKLKHLIPWFIIGLLAISAGFWIYRLQQKNKQLTYLIKQFQQQQGYWQKQNELWQTTQDSINQLITHFFDEHGGDSLSAGLIENIHTLLSSFNQKQELVKLQIKQVEQQNSSILKNQLLTQVQLAQAERLIDSLSETLQIREWQLEEQISISNTLRQQIQMLNIDSTSFMSPKGTKVTYYGKIFSQKPKGFGIGFFEGGGYYIGSWEGNMRHGKGKHCYANGDIYEGDFINDKRNGYGTYHYASGEVYRGEWKNDLMHGKGVIILQDKKRIEGIWQEGKLSNKSNKDSSQIQLP